ncbi:IS66 family transposase [Ectothiorhodospira sp. B14B]|nr:IS66 family transposase [Ectothiorhodospira lacustris]
MHLIMKLIAAIYQVESRLRRQGIDDPEVIRQERQRRTVPILKRLRRLLDRILPSLPPRGDFARAIRYTLNITGHRRPRGAGSMPAPSDGWLYGGYRTDTPCGRRGKTTRENPAPFQ